MPTNTHSLCGWKPVFLSGREYMVLASAEGSHCDLCVALKLQQHDSRASSAHWGIYHMPGKNPAVLEQSQSRHVTWQVALHMIWELCWCAQLASAVAVQALQGPRAHQEAMRLVIFW